MTVFLRTPSFVTGIWAVSSAWRVLFADPSPAFSFSITQLPISRHLWSPSLPVQNRHRHRRRLGALEASDKATAEPSWQSHVSTHPVGVKAFDAMWEDVASKDGLGFAFLFVGPAHAEDFRQIVEHASHSWQQRTLSPMPDRLVSILGGGVIGDNVELDQTNRPSMSLLVGSLPSGATVDILELGASQKQDHPETLLESLNDRFASCLVFSDPYAPIQELIGASSSSSLVLAGGISCPLAPNQPSLAIDDRCLPPQGSIMAIGFGGTLKLQTMVAQGSRPVGDKIYTVTECEGNVITKLDNLPALKILEDVANTATPEEQKLIQSGLLLCGVSKNNSSKPSASMDFLCRQIVGFVPDMAGIAVGTRDIAEGDRFCIQVRDGNTAEKDLELMVQRAKTERLFDINSGGGNSNNRPLAAIQISCVARGRDMFDGVPNVDISNVAKLLVQESDGNSEGFASKPLVGGFFANGEIGPVGLAGFSTTQPTDGQSHVHSFTTVAAVLCDCSGGNSKNGSTEESGEADEEEGSPSMDAWG